MAQAHCWIVDPPVPLAASGVAVTAVNDFNRSLIEEFRANDGKVGGNFEGSPVLLLTTTGAKSGREHTTPLVFLQEHGAPANRIYVFASMGGAPTNPAWYHNVVANPTVTVELPGDRFEARAVIVEGDERERIWTEQKARMPNFAEYERNTTRTIPVIALERVA
jgi:deazaflavin-dependent oxidoreductase (nitroreductase family)